MTYPNLVIAGAPRCGTSSLFRWLADHPNVCTSPMKETRYLLDADSQLLEPRRSYHDAGLAGYEALFARCEAQRPAPHVVMEATPDYLYQSLAPEVLAALQPQPMILFLLRRPSDRVYSHFQFARNNMALLPKEMTFTQFVDAIRAGGPDLESRRNLRHAVDYSRYAMHLSTWVTKFHPSRVRVHLLERMQADPVAFMRTVAGEAGLDPSFYDTYAYPRVNESAETRYRWLDHTRRALARIVPDGALKRAGRRIHHALNVRVGSAGPTDDDRKVLRELDETFASDNARLATMFGLDLREWA